MDKPLVSIIITTYNPIEEYLRITIDSIIKQTYTAWEMIIFDDGSVNQIKPIIDSFQDERIIYRRCDENRGISACANDAVKIAKGEFLAKIDDDDIAYPNWLESMILYLQRNPQINVIGCTLKLMGNLEGVTQKTLLPTREKQQAVLLIQNSAIAHSLCVFRTSFWEKHQLQYDTRYRSAIDYALWVEMAKYTKFYALPDILGVYRRHNNQISTKTYSAQQNFADEVRWNQLRMLEIEPNEEQKKLHNKLSRLIELEKKDLQAMSQWIQLIEKQNRKYLYYDVKALKEVLHQRTATLYLWYFKRTHDISGIKYFLRYATVQNMKNGLLKLRNHGKERK